MATMTRITNSITKLVCNLIPIAKVIVNTNSIHFRLNRGRAYSFILSYILYQLHIIIVGIPIFHRLKPPIKFCIVLINKIIRTSSTHKWIYSTIMKLSSRPFVPIININHIRIRSNCLIPSLLKINSITFRVIHRLI